MSALINLEDAHAFRKMIADEQTQRFLYCAMTEVFIELDSLEGEFDMLFFQKVLARLCSLPYIKVMVDKNDDEDVVCGW